MFVDVLNHNRHNIKLTSQWSKNALEFLNLQICIDKDGHISTDIHRKKMAANSVLHASSSHPVHQINDIPGGEFLRLRRNCCTREIFLGRAKEFKKCYQNRGVHSSRKQINQGFHTSLSRKRDSLLVPKARREIEGYYQPILGHFVV
ncbi:hypothetical protein FKM82_021386 [Ascaphus truei]